jgi:hypothetical protein
MHEAYRRTGGENTQTGKIKISLKKRSGFDKVPIFLTFWPCIAAAHIP